MRWLGNVVGRQTNLLVGAVCFTAVEAAGPPGAAYPLNAPTKVPSKAPKTAGMYSNRPISRFHISRLTVGRLRQMQHLLLDGTSMGSSASRVAPETCREDANRPTTAPGSSAVGRRPLGPRTGRCLPPHIACLHNNKRSQAGLLCVAPAYVASPQAKNQNKKHTIRRLRRLTRRRRF
jgi:hypothetical protein